MSPFTQRRMIRRVARVAVVVAVACGTSGGSSGKTRSRPDLAGTWTLNRNASDFPQEVGFDPNWMASGPAGGVTQGGSSRSGGGGRGGRSGGVTSGSIRLPAPSAHFQSEEDSKKTQELVNEVKVPPAQLTISLDTAAITVVDARGRTRVFHTSGNEDIIQLDAGPVGAITKWEDADLLIRYRIAKDQEVRYWYGRDPGTSRLRVRVQCADHGQGAIIQRVYDAALISPGRPPT